MAPRASIRPFLAAATLSTGVAGQGLALEGGSSGYPMGAENYNVGVVADPGTYLLNYTLVYSAKRINGDRGQSLYPFRDTLVVEAPRFVHAFANPIFGATPFIAVLAAGGRGQLDENLGATRGLDAGVFEAITTAGLGWHLSPTMHLLLTVDEFIPIGGYSSTRSLNLSTNRFVVEPVAAFTYNDPKGFNFSIKTMYDFASYNPATAYTSGQDFHFDYAAGYNVDKWTLGVGGYFEQQMTSDRQYGRSVSPRGNKVTGFAAGPNIQYALGRNVIRFKWQRELIAVNKPQGDMFWLTGVFPVSD